MVKRSSEGEQVKGIGGVLFENIITDLLKGIYESGDSGGDPVVGCVPVAEGFDVFYAFCHWVDYSDDCESAGAFLRG